MPVAGWEGMRGMSERGDDRLLAYLDGELEMTERRAVEAWLDADPAAAAKLAALARSGQLLRLAFDDVMHETLPDRLIAAARGETGAAEPQIVPFAQRRAGSTPRAATQRWRMALPIAASVVGLLAGGSTAYFGVDRLFSGFAGPAPPAAEATAANDIWLDTAAGYFKLFVDAGNYALADVPGSGDPRETLQKISQSLAQAVRLPDLKPWGLTFRGARLVLVGGRPAAQLIYTTDNKAIGPLTLIIGSSRQADIPPTFSRRQDVNLLYWRHQGRAYALVGQADIGYLRGIGNDVAWQLDAI
jgi:anti-sigma factor RsiW